MTRALNDKAYGLLTALAEGPNHGYALAKRVAELSRGRLKLSAGSLYSQLDRLLTDNLIEETGTEVVDGRARRNYRITKHGRGALIEHLEQLSHRVETVRSSLRLT